MQRLLHQASISTKVRGSFGRCFNHLAPVLFSIPSFDRIKCKSIQNLAFNRASIGGIVNSPKIILNDFKFLQMTFKLPSTLIKAFKSYRIMSNYVVMYRRRHIIPLSNEVANNILQTQKQNNKGN